MAKILVSGLAVLDFVFQVDKMPAKPDKYRAQEAVVSYGGGAANAAVAIARHGGTACLAARLGEDEIADIILNKLKLENVDTSLVTSTENGRSSFSSVYVDCEGERQIMNFRGSGLTQDLAWMDTAPQVDAVLADNRWNPGTAKAMAIARKRDIPGVIDGEAPVDEASIRQATHLAFSKPGLEALTGEKEPAEGLKCIAGKFNSWLCVTAGERGVWFTDGGRIEHMPAFQVETRDTLGAGDVWHGVFTLRLAEGKSETDAMQIASAAAALKSTQFGGMAACPTRAATEKILKEYQQCN